MKTLIAYSSKTGNTKKIAESIHQKEKSDLMAIERIDKALLDRYSKIIVGFWVDKGQPNKEAHDFIAQLSHKQVGFFFTLGADPKSEHAQHTRDYTISLLESNGNNVLRIYCCQGKIDPQLTAYFKKMGDKSPHPMTEERIERHRKAATHPDAQDLEHARSIFFDIL